MEQEKERREAHILYFEVIFKNNNNYPPQELTARGDLFKKNMYIYQPSLGSTPYNRRAPKSITAPSKAGAYSSHTTSGAGKSSFVITRRTIQ